ncbi:hypothetical protein [Novosphingobium sp. FKTRR1]|uniref:hypothetical protein n=1 Tax=Novosphingobium sp. FKTRR1 TaxID=2879118 RepID=UPI001CF0577C|nr:hypothetical protein [Novosphingobium sp. FKTRR1]
MTDFITRRYQRPPAERFALFGLPDRPNRCPCGKDGAFVDGQNLQGQRGPYFVWCPDCSRSGPEKPTYDLALASWNRATCLHDFSEIRVVDNATS